MKTPCRLWIFAARQGKGPVAWQDWNPDRRMERRMARLPETGSFYWPCPRDAWRRARVMLRTLGVVQVKVETISGREIGRLYRRNADV
jgi:hypothetical protein